MKPARDPVSRAALRQAAEARLNARPAPSPSLTESELRTLQHELEVRQIELELQDQQFRQLVESIADVFWIASPDLQRIHYVSPAYERIWGRSLESLYAHPHQWIEAVLPADRERVAGVFASLRTTETSVSAEYRIARPDGAVRWILDRGFQVRDAAGVLIRLNGTANDITERKAFERELFEARNYAQTLLAASPIAIVSYKASGETVSANAAAARLVGTTIDGLQKQNFRELDSWRQSEFLARAELALATQREQVFEGHCLTTFGVEIWVACRFVPFPFHGEPHLLLLARDISEHKRDELALRASQERYALAERATQDGLWDWNVLTGEEYFSPRWLEILGLESGEMPGRKSAFLDRVHPADLALVDASTREHLEQGKRYSVEFRLRHKDGSYRWVRSRAEAVRDPAGRPLRMVGSTSDITAQKHMEAGMRESQALYQSLVSQLPVGMFRKDAAGRFVVVNPQYCRLKGMPAEEFLGNTPLDVQRLAISKPEDGGLAFKYDGAGEQHHQRIMQTGEPIEMEEQYLLPDGRTYWLQALKFPVFGADGKVVGSQGILFDITTRKLAEERLRASEEGYQQLFELESDALFLVDAETQIFLKSNRSAQRLYGYGAEEFLRMKAEDISAEPAKTRSTVGTGSLFIPLRWHRKKDGTVFPVEITASLIEHQGRQTELTAIRDITERQQAMSRLLETTAQLLDAQKLASLGSYVFEVATGKWTCSAILDELFGLPAAGFIKDLTGWLDLVHPEDRPDVSSYLTEQVLKKHAAFDRQYRIVRWNDRRERWVHGLGKLVLDDQGRVVKMVGVIQDFTERKRAEEQLSVQVSALTAADNVIVIVNRHGAIEWVNPAFTKVSGYSAAEAVGANPRILKSGQHPPSYYANLWATVLTGNVWRGEIINRHKDGRLYTEEMTVTPVRGAAGQISHFIAIKQDITERRHLENRMQHAQKMEAIGNLAGGIAHDFNNILGAMFGYAHLLQQDTQGDPVAQESVEEILKAANRAKELVQQILTFSRKREQKPEIIKLDLVIREAIKFLRASLPAQIKIELNLAADTPTVLADPTQIYQVTMNLATNALHAMEDRPGRLSVHLDPVQPGPQLLQTHPELKPIQYARLTVADTGHGMDATTLQRIFEPFFTTKQVGRGTGLGLAVVHGIIQSHHGVITVESQLGQGTTFTLYFPAQERTETSPAPVAGAAPHGHRQRILVLDDEPALTSVMQRALRRLDYQVTTSNDAAAVVRTVREQPAEFDLVITDLTMPEMNGLEVARQLHALRPDLPILLLSGYGVAVDEHQLSAAGIRERLEKPVTTLALAEAVARALEKPAP